MKTINACIRLTRPVNVIISFTSIFLGGAVTGTVTPLGKLLLACFSGAIIAGAANAINDVFDLEIDRVNKPHRPLPAGWITPQAAHVYALILFGMGIALGALIHTAGLVVALLSSVFLYLYSAKLKRTVLWGNLTVAFLSGLAFIYGGLALGRIEKAAVVGIFAFFFHLAREIIKDCEDIAGDEKAGISTLPIKYGIPAALRVAAGVMMFLIVLTFLPYFWGLFNIYYLVTVIVGVDLFLVWVMLAMTRNATPENLGKLAVYMKVDMLLGLLAVWVGR